MNLSVQSRSRVQVQGPGSGSRVQVRLHVCLRQRPVIELQQMFPSLTDQMTDIFHLNTTVKVQIDGSQVVDSIPRLGKNALQHLVPICLFTFI